MANLFVDLIKAFLDIAILNSDIHVTRILENGEEERASDVGGVTRDTLSIFWSEFYEACTTGSNFKVPCLRHDY